MECLPIFFGMHLIWWLFWILLIVWIFALPYDIPGSRKSKATSLDILNQRLATGEISEEEYQKKKKLILEDYPVNKSMDQSKSIEK